MNGKEVPFRVELTEPKACQVKVETDAVVPGDREMLFTGTLVNPDRSCSLGYLEGLSQFMDKFGVGVPSNLVDAQKGHVFLRLFNPGEEQIRIRKNTHAAMFIPIEEVIELAPQGKGEGEAVHRVDTGVGARKCPHT